MEGEVGLEVNTQNIKMGDGEHAWNDLEYGVGYSNVTNVLGHSENLAVSQNLVTLNLAKKADIEQMNNSLYNLEQKIGDRISIEGNVVNLPDEEDLISVKESERDVLKLVDRAYTPENFSGKGYKILRKNIREFNLPTVNIVVNSAPVSAGADSTVRVAQTMQMARWGGFDNPFGDLWTNLDGIIIDANANNHSNNMNYVYTCQDASKYADTLNDSYVKVGEEIYNDGYTKSFDLGDAAHIIPHVIGDNPTTYICDYH